MSNIRLLTLDDLHAYRALWLDGLRRFPTAFLLTEGEALGVTDAQLVGGITAGHYWGAFEQERLVGMVCLKRGTLDRLRHTCDLGPLYVLPEAQGRGLARGLVLAAVAAATKAGVLQVELCVDETNIRARDLYLSVGFEQFGRRPRSVFINGVPRDDLLMMKRLDG